jgi:DNA polymerase III epsilon subunit-like protein
MEPILVFDTETTGLLPHPSAPLAEHPHIIEFGAVLMSAKSGKVEEEISILINPGVPITEEITRITGLTDNDVRDAGRFVDVLPQLERVFAAAGTVVAHNLPFDRGMIRAELRRQELVEFPWPGKEVCTVGLYREIWGRNPRLIELYEYIMEKPLAQTHRALDDVMALVDIIQHEKLWRDVLRP